MSKCDSHGVEYDSMCPLCWSEAHTTTLTDMRTAEVRTFETGATRSPLGDKLQYEGYLNPLVLQRFAQYMKKHQTQADGTQRAADNWQQGIPRKSLMDSKMRHDVDLWLHHRGYGDMAVEPIQEALCGIMFNTMAYLLEELRDNNPECERLPIGFRDNTWPDGGIIKEAQKEPK